MERKRWSDLPTIQSLQEANAPRWDDIFPDTEAGAKACLAAQSTIKIADMGRAIPDPMVMGVWKIFLLGKYKPAGCFAIVYMKGHRDSWGNKRETNDFEDNCD